MSKPSKNHLDQVNGLAEQVSSAFLEDFIFSDEEQAKRVLEVLKLRLAARLSDEITENVQYWTDTSFR